MASASASHSKQSNATQITITPLTMPSSVASTSQNSVQSGRLENSQSATQYEHVTVVTQLGQQSVQTSRCDTNSASGSMTYNINANVGTSGLQIHPPSALTQQMQLSVPSLAGASLPKVGAVRGSVRPQSFRNNGARTQKTPLSAMLPMMGRGTAKQLVSMSVIGDDGPTVRQHLQQQQQKARLQQQLAMQAKQKEEEAAKKNLNDSNSQHMAYSLSSSSNDHLSTSAEVVTAKAPIRNTHVQRPYTPRVSTVQRQRAAAEAVRKLQLKNPSSTGLAGSLPPISLGPSRPMKMSRIPPQVNSSEAQNGNETVTVLQSQQQPTSTYQTVRQVHYRQAAQNTGPQLVRSNSQPVSGQSMEPVYQMTPQISNECQQAPTASSSVLSGVSSQQMKLTSRKRPHRLQSQVRVTFLEPSKSVNFVSPQSAPPIGSNSCNSNYPALVQSSQSVYGAPRQIATARELSQVEQFYSSSPSTATNASTSGSPELIEQNIVQRQQILQQNSLRQQNQVQIVTQQQFQQSVNQQQFQVRNVPQMQQQGVNQSRLQQVGTHQQLQEVVVTQQQHLVDQQQLHQVQSQPQMQAMSNQQSLQPTYQSQQRVVQLSQQMHQQRIRRQPLQHSEQRQQPSTSQLQHQLQSQPQQIQQLHVQQQLPSRQSQQFQQQPQHMQSSYSPRFQQPRLQLSGASAAPCTLVNEQFEGVVVRHQNSVAVGHHPQVCMLPPGVTNRSSSQNPQQRIYNVPQHMAQQQREDQIYLRKLYFLKTSTRALTYKNAALCDEIARLNQRIRTVSDQRR